MDIKPYYGNTMKTISFKVSPEEVREIRERAKRGSLTVSEYLRRQAMAPVSESSKIERLRCPLTGAVIFGGMEASKPITVESTREMLSDFP